MKMAALRKESWDEKQESAVRFLNQARESSEDLMNEVHRHIRRHPWKSVAVALTAGFVLGAVFALGAKD